MLRLTLISSSRFFFVISLFYLSLCPSFLFSQETADFPLYVLVLLPGDANEFIVNGKISSDFELVSIETAEIDSFLFEYCTDEINEAIALAAADGIFTPQELREIGFDFVFNSGNLDVNISVPLDSLKESTIFVKGRRSLPSYQNLEVSPFSMALPLWLQIDGNYFSNDKSTFFSGELKGSPVIAFRNWVLESDLVYTQALDTTVFSIENTGLIYDFPELGLRAKAGQLNYPVRGFQTSEPLLGLSASPESFGDRNFSSGAIFGSYFEIEESSTVKVYINGRLLRSYRLDPGKYNFEDFPLSPGLNNVRIEIIDRFGHIELVETEVPYASQLLNPGELVYSGAIGFREWDFDNIVWDYPVLTTFVRRGMTQKLSLGANLQGSATFQMLGIESIYASSWGVFQPHLAGSLYEGNTPGGAFLLQYSLPSFPDMNFPSVSLSTRFQSRDFKLLSDDNKATKGDGLKWGNTLSLTQTLPANIVMLAGLTHRNYYDDQIDLEFFTGLNRTFNGIITLRVSAGWAPFQSLDSWQIGLNLAVREPSNRANINSQIIVPDNILDINASGTYISSSLKGNASIGIQDVGFTDATLGGVNTRIGGETFRADMAAYGNFEFNGRETGGSELEEINYGINLGSGVYYADGLVGIGKAVRSGFVIARNEKTVPAESLLVNPTNKGADGESDWLGPIVVSGYSPYQPKAVILEPTGIPADYSLGNTSYIYHPRYRSGVGIEVTGNSQVYIRGKLLDSGGIPISLKGLIITPLLEGKEISLDNEDNLYSFTDENGQFEVYGLIPGEYLIMVQGRKEQSSKIVIESSEIRFLDMGEMTASFYLEDF